MQEHDIAALRQLFDDWVAASRAGDTARVLELMDEDAVFLQPAQPPLCGRAAFAAAAAGMAGSVRFEVDRTERELVVEGDFAWCWSTLSLRITPVAGGPAMLREGPVLSLLRRGKDGRWRLLRDANMLGPARPAEP